MGIWQQLQNLSFGEKVTTLLAVAGLVVALVALVRQVRIDARVRASELRERRAIVKLERAESVNRGAAITLGGVVHKGAAAGQYFFGAIKNDGPHMAEAIRVTASLGNLAARATKAPETIGPHSTREPLELVVPFGAMTYADVAPLISAGTPLQIRVDFADGTPDPDPLVRCFTFRLEDVDDAGGRDWFSHEEPCVVRQTAALPAGVIETDPEPASLEPNPAVVPI
jgi:hypothetical protein